MKALTICQPYAHLIVTGEKRVENRTWPTRHRGLIYIHAGKSMQWMDVENGIDVGTKIPVSSMAFGAVVAIAELVDCVSFTSITNRDHDARYPWLREHRHTNGPWCWILDKVAGIGPWPWRGAQGLFEIDEAELDKLATRVISE